MVTGGIRDLLKQDLAREFCRKKNKERHQYFNWNSYEPWANIPYKKQLVRLHLFLSWSSHTNGLPVLFHLGLEGITEVSTDPKERFVSFKGRFVSLKWQSSLSLCLFREPGNILLGSVRLQCYMLFKLWLVKIHSR